MLSQNKGTRPSSITGIWHSSGFLHGGFPMQPEHPMAPTGHHWSSEVTPFSILKVLDPGGALSPRGFAKCRMSRRPCQRWASPTGGREGRAYRWGQYWGQQRAPLSPCHSGRPPWRSAASLSATCYFGDPGSGSPVTVTSCMEVLPLEGPSPLTLAGLVD